MSKKSDAALAESQHKVVSVLGRKVNLNKVNSAALRKILENNHIEPIENWNKHWNKHEKCCMGCVFGG